AVRDIEIARNIRCDPIRRVKLRLGSHPVGTTLTSAGDRSHHARRCELPDRAVCSIRDVDIVRAIHRDAMRIEKPRVAPRAISAARTPGQASESAHYCRGSDFAYSGILRIRNVNITATVRHDAIRMVKPG